MFYHNLGGTFGSSITASGDPNLALFPTLQSRDYWSGTESDSNHAWGFYFSGGYQLKTSKLYAPLYSWAVHDGNVGGPDVITIDIKPSKKTDVNVIDLKKDKNLKVAIVGSSFDALQVDPDTVKFGLTGVEASPVRFKGQDYNHDGYSDLILTFKLSKTGIECNDTSATLTGQTIPDTVIDITGSDTFTVEPPCL